MRLEFNHILKRLLRATSSRTKDIKSLSMEQIVLKLYVTGTTARSSRAIANLDAISKMLLGEKLEFSVINILEYPELAESEKILATPTLIKYFPLPMRRLIGDLSSREQVLEGLDIVVA